MATLKRLYTFDLNGAPVPMTPPIAPVAGRMLVVSAATRNIGNGPAGIAGWTIIAPGVFVTSGGYTQRELACFWRIAQAGDTTWNVGASGTHFTYSEWADVGAFLAAVSIGGINQKPIPCGGPIVPAVKALVIGMMACGYTNDGDTLSVAPDPGSIELDDKNGQTNSPGYWSAYKLAPPGAAASISGVGTTGSGIGVDQVGITAAFSDVAGGAFAGEPGGGVW